MPYSKSTRGYPSGPRGDETWRLRKKGPPTCLVTQQLGPDAGMGIRITRLTRYIIRKHTKLHSTIY